jgi:hypothetical protein
VCGSEHDVGAVQSAQFEEWLEKRFKKFCDISQKGAHWNQRTRILEGLPRVFYVLTNILLVFLLYDTLKMVTRVTERCQSDK